MDEMRLISQRAYPVREFVPEYTKSIENVQNKELRLTLKLLACSGLRIGELLNAYLYDNGNGEVVVRALAEKVYKQKHVALHKMPARRFLGASYLAKMLGSDVWRSKTIKNLFGFHLAEVLELVSESPRRPEWLGPSIGMTYKRLYNTIKKEFSAEISYKASKREVAFRTHFSPSFHFFRKLYSAELAFQTEGNPALAVAKVTDDMQWQSSNMLMHYVKDYTK